MEMGTCNIQFVFRPSTSERLTGNYFFIVQNHNGKSLKGSKGAQTLCRVKLHNRYFVGLDLPPTSLRAIISVDQNNSTLTFFL